MLRATTACTFSTSQLPKVLRAWCVVFCTFWLGNLLCGTTACNFWFLIWPDGSAPAALASLLFEPLEPQNIGKTECFATFFTFSRTSILFLLTLSRLWSYFFFSSLLFSSSSSSSSSSLLFSDSSHLWLFPPLLFHLSILAEVCLLSFLR